MKLYWSLLQKNWAKLANSVHSRVRNNPQTAIQGCHCQLDYQCRGPSIKEKDHRVGSLTSASLKLRIFCLKASSYCSLNMFFSQLSGPVKFSENLDSKWQEGWHSDTNWNVTPAKEHICLKFLLRCPLFQWYHELIQSVFEIRKVAFFNHSMVYHTSKYQSSSKFYEETN